MNDFQNRPESSEPLSQYQLLEPLVKAMKRPKLGQWGGLDVIAIGPKGGKIVGYDSAGKPIYAGSKKAERMSLQQAQATAEEFATAGAVKEWLSEVLGVPAIVGPKGEQLFMSDATAKLIEQHFGVKSKQYKTDKGIVSKKLRAVSVADLIPHLGKPLAPKTPEEAATFAAKAGSGELDKDPFPPLDQLQRETGTKAAAQVEGTHHQLWLFSTPDGRKFVFKFGDPMIARAEEAACRTARLILGAGNAPAAKHVELNGKPGTLVEWIDGKPFNAHSHSNPPSEIMQANFEDVIANEVVDWLVANHDGHAGNFLATKDGIAAIDKGQAWKWYGEDKLSTTYSPNPSKPIYVKFWKEFLEGNIKGDPVAAARKAIEAAEKVTPEQYKQIVMPYAIEKAKQEGGDPEKIADHLVSRLSTLRKDWEKFLSKVLGKKVSLKKEHEDNFETMPESGLSEPSAPVAMAEPATKPVQKEDVPGWPQTKGPVTVFNPGSPPSPGAKWPKGYPGDGFQAQVKYKGELFTVEFAEHDGGFVATMHFPDGTTHTFPSPNAASDAMVLYKKGLPLTLTATEKKEKAISYPAGTAFGIKKFKDELAASQTAKPEDLTAKFEPPKAEAAPWWETTPEDNWETMPAFAADDWVGHLEAFQPGTTFRMTTTIGTVSFVEKQPDGSWKTTVWPSGVEYVNPSSDIADGFSNAAKVEIAKEVPALAPVIPLPVPEKPKTAEDELAADVAASDAAFLGEGLIPIPDASVLSVATMDDDLPEGFKFGYTTSTGFHMTMEKVGPVTWKQTNHSMKGIENTMSLADASKILNQMVDEGQTVFWATTVAPTEKPTGWDKGLWPVPEPFGPPEATAALNNFPVGTGLKFETHTGEDVLIIKQGDDTWAGTVDDVEDEFKSNGVAITLAQMAAGAPIYVKLPAGAAPPEAPLETMAMPAMPDDAKWIWLPDPTGGWSSAQLNAMPIGTVLSLAHKGLGKDRILIKKPDGRWLDGFVGDTTGVLRTGEAMAGHVSADYKVHRLTPEQAAVVTAPKTKPKKEAAPKVDTEKAKVSVPASAPTTFSGPMPPGATKVVKKKFPGKKKMDVKLVALDDGGFEVQIWDGATLLSSSEFETLSAASDWVWVKQKGYQDATDYKQQTGKNKVPSGGGWKFWGIDPKAVTPPPIPETAPAPAPAPAPGGVVTTFDKLDAKPEGAKVNVDGTTWEKTGSYTWATEDGKAESSYSLADKIDEAIQVNWEGAGEGDPKDAAIGVLSGGKYDQLINSGMDVMWAVDMKPGDKIDFDYGVGPITGSKADQLLEAGLVVFKIEGPGVEHEDAHPAIAVPNKETLEAAPVGSAVVISYTAPATGEVVTKVAKKWSNEKWKWVGPGEYMDSAELFNQVTTTNGVGNVVLAPSEPMPSAVPAPAPAPVPAPTPTKYPKAKVITKAHEIDAGFAAEQSLVKVLDLAEGWQKSDNPDIPPQGAKSSEWPGWVPPAGLIIEGKHPTTGAKFWMTTVVMGFSGEGKAFKGVKFAIIDEGGTIHEGLNSASSPVSALKSAAKDAGITDLNGAQLKSMFGINGALFAAGETLTTIATGSGPSAVPASSNVLDKAKPDMTPEEAKQPVKVSMTLAQAFKATFNNGTVQPGMGSALLTVPVPDGITSVPDLANNLEQFFEGLGLGTLATVSISPSGVVASIPASYKEHEVVVTMQAGEAASHPSPSQDNWDTMPDGIPKVLDPEMGEWGVENMLGKCPVGTMVVGLTGESFTKVGDVWTGLGDTHDDNDMAVILTGIKAVIVPPDGTAPVPKPKKKKKKPAKKKPEGLTPEQKAEQEKKAAEQKEKIEQAKKLAVWAKEHPPVSDEEVILVLSHFQAIDPEMKLRARMSPDGKVMLQSANPEDWTEFVMMFENVVGADYETVDSPTENWFAFDIADMKAGIPNNAASTIDGPDGKTYPAGTKFKTKTVKTTVEETLESEVTKIVPHKTNKNLKMVKLVGTNDETKDELAKILETVGVDAEITQGGHYTMAAIPTSAFKKVHKTEKVVVPTIPEQPPRFVSVGLPTSGGLVRDNELAERNFTDLAVMETIITSRHGRFVRCGKHGLFWNDQLNVRRVKKPDGTMAFEVTGQLRDIKTTSKMESGDFVFDDAAETKNKHDPFKQQTWDADTGAIIQNGKSIEIMNGRVGKTDSGSSIEVLNDSGKPALHGVFKVTVDEGKDLVAELGDAFGQMGLDPADVLRDQTDEDERMFKKEMLLRSWNGTDGMKQHYKQAFTSEEELDAALKAAGVPQKVIDSLEIRTSFNGKHVPCVTDQADRDKRKAAGCEFLYMGMSLSDCFSRILDGQGMGSNRTKWMSGVRGCAASVSADHAGGGTSMVFTRMGNVNASGSWGYKCSGPKFIVHPRVLDRTDWTGFNHDAFGHWNIDSGQARQQAFKNKVSSNETDFEDGISHQDLCGLTVNDQSDKDQIISWLKGEGITEINGIALEDFVIVISGSSRKQIADKCVGLKEGVLP